MMFFRLLILGIFFGCSIAAAKLNPPYEKDFQAEKYLGTWYEIARLPNWFEKNLMQVTATYSQKDEKSLTVLNKGYHKQKKKWKEAKGIAKFATQTSDGHLRVSFFRPFYADYFVLEVDDAYQYALVGGNSPNYLWILAREKTLDSETIKKLLNKALN